MKTHHENPIDILLVEDNPHDAELTIYALKKANLLNPLLHLEDGQLALDYLFAEGGYAERDTSQRPKVVLLDLKMPRVDGREVLKRIKSSRETRDIPVVILTSSSLDPDIKHCYELGANGYIVKPVDFENFARSIAEIGLYWLMVSDEEKRS